jgi:hypothetical protein
MRVRQDDGEFREVQSHEKPATDQSNGTFPPVNLLKRPIVFGYPERLLADCGKRLLNASWFLLSWALVGNCDLPLKASRQAKTGQAIFAAGRHLLSVGTD